MCGELLAAFAEAHDDKDVRTIVLTGAGDKAFCAGGDFKQMPTNGPAGDYADVLLAMVNASKPIIARVNGYAMGGGLGLVAASHFAIAVPNAKLGTPEIDVGLFPMMIMSVLRRVMRQRDMTPDDVVRRALCGATRPRAWVSLSQVVPREELDAAVAALCETIGGKSPKTIALGLEAMAKQHDLPLEEALPYLRERLGASVWAPPMRAKV